MGGGTVGFGCVSLVTFGLSVLSCLEFPEVGWCINPGGYFHVGSVDMLGSVEISTFLGGVTVRFWLFSPAFWV